MATAPHLDYTKVGSSAWRKVLMNCESDFEEFLKTIGCSVQSLGQSFFSFRFSIELPFETGMNSRIDSFPS